MEKIINKLNEFIVEVQNCDRNDAYEDIKKRVKSYLMGIYGKNHSYCKDQVLSKENEECDYFGLYSHSKNGKWIDTSVSEDRPLTKDKSPLIAHINKVIATINKDGLPLNVNPSMVINQINSPGANAAVGYNSSITQSSSVSMSDFNKHYQPAIDEIKNSDLTEEQKTELLAMLEMFKDSLEKDGAPHSYVINKLKEFSLKAISIGADIATIFSLFIQPHLDAISK